MEKHRALRADGQQQDYATLPAEERYKEEMTGVPVVYVHTKCGVATRMPDEIVRSYLQNPYLYLADSTFCVGCSKQVPNRECVWSETGENLQSYFDALRAKKPEFCPAGFNIPNPTSSIGVNETKASGFSFGRVGMGLAAILIMGFLGALQSLLKNDGGQAAPRIQNNQPVQPADEDWAGKIKRGEDVPEPILMLSGIKPADYKVHQLQVRLNALTKQDKFEEGVKLLDEALVDSPNSEFVHNSKAWMLATCKVDSVRNGKLAVEHATKACELGEDGNPSNLDTLAAAYAETGDFDSAIKHIETAVSLTKDEAQKQRFATRLELYKNHQPFREQ